ncbi:MAG TPA: TIGR03118 family protein [Puia sp.]|nr:TIGR03118 family protein [Puia sp.]
MNKITRFSMPLPVTRGGKGFLWLTRGGKGLLRLVRGGMRLSPLTRGGMWLLFGGIMAVACHKSNITQKDLRNFEQVVLVANKAMYMPKLVDTTLQNGWGLAWAPSGIAWVNANGDHVSELYTGEGAIVRPPVNIPSPTDSVGGAPSGIVFSGGKGFVLANHQGANFLFVGEDGILSGWNGADGNNAQRIRDRSATSVYKGLALDSTGPGQNFIYAANFMTGKIDVWDTGFHLVSMPFHDPALPAHYAPFNIVPVGQWLFVMYAEQTPGSIDEMHGPGKGIVDVFNTDGSFVHRFASRGSLNAPWGAAWAPAGWLSMEDMSGEKGGGDDSNKGKGSFGEDGKRVSEPVVLIGNFGDGRINVFSPDGEFLGQLRSHNKTIVIDGLWALGFAPATATSIDPNRLYFTAGPADEADGIFGYLIKQ